MKGLQQTKSRLTLVSQSVHVAVPMYLLDEIDSGSLQQCELIEVISHSYSHFHFSSLVGLCFPL